MLVTWLPGRVLTGCKLTFTKYLASKYRGLWKKWAEERLEKGSPSDVTHQSFIHAGVYFYTGCQVLLGTEDSSKEMAEKGLALVAPTVPSLVGKTEN